MSIPVDSVHHIEDVGHLLLEAQRDLARVRQRLDAMPLEAATGGDSSLGSDTLDSLRDILNKTESNLRVKAEAVLKSVEENRLNTLPAVTSQPMRYYGDFHLSSVIVQPENAIVSTATRNGGQAAASPTKRQLAQAQAQAAYMRRPVADRMHEARAMELLSRPMDTATMAGVSGNVGREAVQEMFGASSPAASSFSASSSSSPSSSALSGSRPIERYGRSWRSSSLARGSRIQPQIVPRVFRNNPKLFPPINRHDTQQGILNLVQKGYIPPFVDVSSAFTATPAPLQQSPSTFHHYAEQFERSKNQVALHSFNLSQVKLDLGDAILQGQGQSEAQREEERRRASMQQQAMGVEEKQQHPHSLQLTQQQMSLQIGAPTLQATTFDFPLLMPGEDESQALVPSASSIDDLLSAHLDGNGGEMIDPNAGKVRDYDELLDTYSLHQFLIRKGKTLAGTPEFLSFQRKYSHIWGSVKSVILALERVCKEYSLPLATIRGEKVIQLAEDEYSPLTPEALFGCFAFDPSSVGAGNGNVDPLLRALLLAPKQAKYRMGGSVARLLASLKIQSTWRMFVQRRLYLNYRFRHTKAILIQRCWKKFQCILSTRRTIIDGWNARLHRWRQSVQNPWKQTYTSSFLRKQRVHVHVPSISSEPYQRQALFNFTLRENMQMSRLCDAADENIDVIYLAPFAINSDVQSYYLKLLEVGGVSNISQRVKILVPENSSRFPEHFSLSKLALYSPKLLRKIRESIRGRPACIVPGEVGLEDLQLAIELNIPLLAPEPEIVALFGSKSGSKRIFAAAEICVAPGAHDIYDEQDLFAYLAKLIVSHLSIQRWLLKIDNESGGRGIACLDTSNLKIVASLRAEKNQHANRWLLPEVLANAQERVIVSLRRNAAKRIVMAYPALYDNKWSNYAAAFYRVGGVIEAAPPVVIGSPSVNVFISPSGDCTILSAHDQVFSSAFVFSGCNFPSSAPSDLIHPPALAIARQCFKEGVIGFVGMDFVAWSEGNSGVTGLSGTTTLGGGNNATAAASSIHTPKIWGVDLNLRMTSTQSSFQMFQFLLRGRYVYNTTALLGLSSPTGATTQSAKDIPLHLRPPARYLVPSTPPPFGASAGNTARSASRSASSASLNNNNNNSSRESSRPSSGNSTPKLPELRQARINNMLQNSNNSSSSSAAPVKEEDRFYSCVPYLYQPHLATVQFGSFFHLCRAKGISFDVRTRQGSLFLLLDSLASGTIGLMCVGCAAPPSVSSSSSSSSSSLSPLSPSPLHSMQLLLSALSFLNQQVSSLRFGVHQYDAESNLLSMLNAYKGLVKAQKEANQIMHMEQQHIAANQMYQQQQMQHMENNTQFA